MDRLHAMDDPRRGARLVLWPGGLAVGLVSLWLAGQRAVFSFAGDSTVAVVAELVAGWWTIAIGLISWRRRPRNRFGPLLTAAGFAWFLADWTNPGGGSSLLFTVGLVLYAACPAFVAHAVLAYPSGRLASAMDRLMVGMAYVVNIVILGLIPALFFDPAAEECGACPSNLLSVAANPSLNDGATKLGLWLALVWAPAAVMLAGRHLLRATPAARRVTGPVLLAGIAFLSLFVADLVHSERRGTLSNDEVDVALWFGQAAALIAIATGVVVEWIRARRSRERVARLVVELSQSPVPGGLRDVLAVTLGDPLLELAYPIGEGRFADATGRSAEPVGESGRISTHIVRGGEVVALLGHRADLLDEPARVDAVLSAAGLALASERLQAASRSQFEELRASRGRIVEAGDVERRRLERDLHDGAQQRLVSVSLTLRHLRRQLDEADARPVGALIAEAEAELRTAFAELRQLAHGIYPASLADEGLAAAIEALAEASTTAIEVVEVPQERCIPGVEAAAYFVIAQVTRRGTARHTKVSARSIDGRLVVEIEDDGSDLAGVADLDDRVGAVGGEVQVARTAAGLVTVRAEIPCAS